MRTALRIRWLALVLALAALVAGTTDARAEQARANESATRSALAWPGTAVHAGRIEGDHVTWRSSFVNNVSIDPPARWEQLRLAQPLEAALDEPRSPGVTAVRNERGAIAGLLVDTERVADWRAQVDVTLRAPLARDGDAIVLAPPLGWMEGVQRLDLTGEGELRFEPDTSDGLVHNVGSWSTPGISEDLRRDTNLRLGGRDTPLDESPVYVTASAPAIEHGLRGHARTASERARPGLVLAVFLSLALGVAGVAAYRWLGQGARIEQAEAFLREEFERDGR